MQQGHRSLKKGMAAGGMNRRREAVDGGYRRLTTNDTAPSRLAGRKQQYVGGVGEMAFKIDGLVGPTRAGRVAQLAGIPC